MEIMSKAMMHGFLAAAVLAMAGVMAADPPSPAKATAPAMPEVKPAEHEAFFGARIQRTMTLLATSSTSVRHKVKILFLGQSIVEQPWRLDLEQELRRRFPLADLTVVNAAIGGWEAPYMVRTMVHTVIPEYPDLVVFHIYNGEFTGEVERIISNIRRATTAEILIFPHHISGPKDYTEEQARAQYVDSAAYWRCLGQQYNCEIAEVREEWWDYLTANGFKHSDLLTDLVHLNDKGNLLMQKLVGRHFRFNTLFPGGWTDVVRTCEAKRLVDEGADDEITFTGTPWPQGKGGKRPDLAAACVVGSSPDSTLQLTFDGNRVDVIAGYLSDQKLGTAKILIDNKPPSQYPELYVFTAPDRTTPPHWWPQIRRVSHAAPLVVEDWKLTITEVSKDDKFISFEVEGSVTGKDGTGSNREKFVSKSGRVVIEPRDFIHELEKRYDPKGMWPVGFTIVWRVVPKFADVFAPVTPAEPSHESSVTVAQGLKNDRHTLTIVPNGDGPVPVNAVRVYRPPLR